MRISKFWAPIFLVLMTSSCARPTEQSVTAVKSGDFKVDVRSQEFDNSGVRNVDICVTDAASRDFPEDKDQCFLHGFDFSGLSIKWLSERKIAISFKCGRVSTFSNFALVSEGHDVPVQFHATLDDQCHEMQ